MLENTICEPELNSIERADYRKINCDFAYQISTLALVALIEFCYINNKKTDVYKNLHNKF